MCESRRQVFFLGVAVSLFLVTATGADQWVSPDPLDVKSADGRHQAHIAVGGSLGETVGFAGARLGDHARANLTGPGGESWSYDLLNPIAPVDAYLLDDGRLLTFDNWHSMGYGEVVVLYESTGEVIWQLELEDLLDEDLLYRVPTSVSSRWWRRRPLELAFEGEEESRALAVTLWNEDRLKIRLRDGHSAYSEVEDLPADPRRLKARAKDLSQREDDRAVSLFEKVIELDPSDVDGYRELAWFHQRSGEYERAIEVLSRGLAVFPIKETPPTEHPRDPRLWLLLELGRVYEDMDDLGAAEKAYREVLKLNSGYSEPAKALARIWLRTGREEEADRLLTELFGRRRGEPGSSRAKSELKRAAMEVARVYEYSDPAKARDYYLRAYDESEPDTHLALGLADSLERLGERNEALAVLRNLLDWLHRKEGPDTYVRLVSERIERVEKAGDDSR